MLNFNSKLLVSWGVFFILLASYWLTVPPTVSFWDCPEYMAGAWRLEIGHPPGNPVWMLVERVVTMLAPSGEYAALFVNLSSGLFTAFAGFFLTNAVWLAAGWIVNALPRRPWASLTRAVVSATAGLAFGWCDSTWYSAVEAEVYAMSVFMTALCVWLMVKWAFCADRNRSSRLLVLIAYLFGLSIGIHLLNLLCIPALAMVWAIKRGVRSFRGILLLFLLSLLAVGCVLAGMIPSTISLAAEFELFAVNTLGLPYLWGVAAYVILLGVALLLALTVTARSSNRGAMAAAVFPAIFLSGIFIFSSNFAAGAAVSAIVSLLLVRGHNFTPRRLNLCMWMLAMLLAGYSAYAIIPIRGDIPSPANPSFPGDPFSFASYQAREQYGGAPLLRGHTPLSRNILIEEFPDEDSVPVYRRIAMRRGHQIRARLLPGARLGDPYRTLTASDSAENSRLLQAGRDAYVVKGYNVKPVTTPELDMWFPRITSRDKADMQSFSDWAGMTHENMVSVSVTEALDSTGQFVTRLDASGRRPVKTSRRPTYAQSLRMFLTYQTGYMYFRYLLWNFSGRQNDVHSTGEVEHGNFITGFPLIDNAMLGAEEDLPDELGADNKGRNRYFMLPLILGIIGIVWLLRAGKRGRKTCVVVFMLFVMTGLAIVVYLNQAPGEPRERDYSFLGSYFAFAAWIGFGALALMRGGRRYAPIAAIIPLFTVIWMACENFDDHDRSGRRAASRLAANTLNSLEPDAILFVNGDNGTFPLWYASEVEGIRKDVRVVNLAYLSIPQYSAALMKDWDGAAALPSILRPEWILYNALLFPRIDSKAPADSVADAVEMLRLLGMSGGKPIGVRNVTFPSFAASGATGNQNITYPLSNLSKSGKGDNLDFGRLMLFNFLVSNAASPNPRPVYWQRSLPRSSAIGLDSLFSTALLTLRLGDMETSQRRQEYLRGLAKLQAPNDAGRHVYMDAIPALHISSQRASLILASREMLRAGDIATASRLAMSADSLMGDDPRSFVTVTNADTLFSVRRELAALLDSIAARQNSASARKFSIRAVELRRTDSIRRAQYIRYKKALPPRLRSKT